jgi:hypothetical protein
MCADWRERCGDSIAGCAYLTLAHGGGERFASDTGDIRKREQAQVLTGQEAGWAS